jgi:hypothetical protein
MTRPRVITVGKKSDFPYEVWGERDKADARLAEPLGQVSAPVPLHTPVNFSLHEQPATRRQRRSRAVDALLAGLGICARAR